MTFCHLTCFFASVKYCIHNYCLRFFFIITTVPPHSRRQSRSRLLHGQADHQAVHQGRRCRQQRPRRRRQAEIGFLGELQSHPGREDHAGGRPLRTDLNCRNRSIRHRQHEVPGRGFVFLRQPKNIYLQKAIGTYCILL